MTKLMTVNEFKANVDKFLSEAADDLRDQADEQNEKSDPIDRDEIRVGLDLLEISISELTIAALTEEQVVLLKEWVDSESADIATIGDLEKVMKADSWWWKTISLANDGHAQIVQRVISTLLAFRSVNPVKVE